MHNVFLEYNRDIVCYSTTDHSQEINGEETARKMLDNVINAKAFNSGYKYQAFI